MTLVSIDHGRCRRDGLCSAVCPAGLFENDPDGFPQFLADGDQRCIRCGHCVAVCGFEALQHVDLPLHQAPIVDRRLQLDQAALDQLLQARRSIREFKSEPVPEALVKEAIEAARFAPSAVNRQPVEWLVIQDPTEVRQLAGLVVEFLRGVVEPRYAAYIAMWDQGQDPILRSAPHLVVVHAPDDWSWSTVDSTIALTQFELAAVARGIGTCWAGFLMRAAVGHPPLREALGIPTGHSVTGALMYGLPRYRYHRIPPRQAARVTWR